MPVRPLLRTPLTDLTSQYGSNHQEYGQCRELEMKTLNCLEAYGARRGAAKCRDLIEDYYECFENRKQEERVYMMKAERNKLPRKQRYELPPREDAYPTPWN